jgi:YidC/Oxa1 family membrane protein insertase
MTSPVARVLAVLGSPLRLSAFDLLSAVIITMLATTVAVAPVLAQDGSPGASGAAPVSPVATAPPVVQPTAGPRTIPSASATTPVASPTAVPTPSPTPGPTAPPCPNPTSPPAPTLAPGQTATPVPTLAPGQTPTPTRHPNLCPAQPGANPLDLIAWLFTPIFQLLFMGLALAYNIFGDIGIAIVVLTLVIRILLVPVFRAQIVSQRRMQMLQPELRAIATRYKGNRAKISEEQMKLYRDRGVNPASGCLPALLQLVLLVPMYQVFTQGLSAPDITSMLQIFGNPVITVQCQDPGNPYVPCMNPHIWWLGWLPRITNGGLANYYPAGLPANLPEVFLALPIAIFAGLSLLAVVSALLQLVQTRMMTTRSDDPQQRTQQRLFLILPLFSLLYGGILPAGLFVYWITTTIFSIVQQYLINGWGGMFPLFGWTPGFARDHQPRFPIPPFTPRPEPSSPSGGGSTPTPTARRSPADSAAGTIRPARTSRRGRRR